MKPVSLNSAANASPNPPSLMDAIQEYHAAMADFDAQDFGDDVDQADTYAAISYMPPLKRLEAWETPAESYAAALAALKLAHSEVQSFSGGGIPMLLLGAAIAFFEGKAVRHDC